MPLTDIISSLHWSVFNVHHESLHLPG
jgi:hypothetical protein